MLINPITLSFAQNFYNQPGAPLALVGPDGIGKINVAKWFSKQLLDANDINNHPYIFYIDAGISGIEDIRELQKNLRLIVPGKNVVKRVTIINNFEKFGREAQNSLLKLIEEPPTDTQIIILINNPSFVLPTILSRVQIINVLPVGLDQSIEYFNDKYSEADLKKAYAISAGNSELMQRILENDESSSLIVNIERAKEILSKDKYVRISQIDKILKDKDVDISNLIESFIKILIASYKQSLINHKNVQISLDRLNSAIKCLDDISLGVNKKLALTQFFSKI